MLSFCSFVSTMNIDQQLIDAAKNGNAEQVQILLDARANVNARARDGLTPLHLAVRFGHETVVRLLLKNNANIEAKDFHDYTPLHWVNGREAIARLLLANNANIKAEDGYGCTPLSWAVFHGQEAVARLLKNWPAFQELLIKSREKNLAFCMAQHPRLGANSSANVLPNELFYYIFKLSKPTIEDLSCDLSTKILNEFVWFDTMLRPSTKLRTRITHHERDNKNF